jgi:hypothetical protein
MSKSKRNAKVKIVKNDVLSIDLLSRARQFAKEKPYFLMAIIIAMAAIALFLMQYYSVDSFDSEKASYAKQLYMDNNSILYDFSENVALEMKNPPLSTLDDDYLYSIKSDLDWLIAKNDSIFNSKPNTQVFEKEFAFSLLMQRIIEVNNAFVFEIGEPDYQGKIGLAQNLDINAPNLLTEEEYAEYFVNDSEKKVFNSSVQSIFAEYVSMKKILLKNSDSIERKYVEAKKLLILSQDYNSTTQ